MVALVETPIVAATVVVLALRRRLRGPQAPSPPDRVGGSRLFSTASPASTRRANVRGRERPARRGLEPEALTDDLRSARRDIDWGRRRGHRSPAARATSPIADDLAGGRAHHERDACQRRCRPRARIAADESRATWSLRRERRQVMLTYLIVIYISFLVFLGIIASLSVSFIPAIEEAAIPGAGAGTGASDLPGAPSGPGGSRTGLGTSTRPPTSSCSSTPPRYRRSVSGLVAGQLGEGSVRDGVKHVVALLLLLTLATSSSSTWCRSPPGD